MWLHEIPPTLDALINYLSKENGIRITEKESGYDAKEKTEVHKMSDGFSYVIRDNKWVCLD